MSANSAHAYNSEKIAAAAGKYYAIAISVDYFFEQTKCVNTQFGMRKKGKMRDFVYQDIENF